MERVANRSVGQMWVVYQGADHHGPRVQSQADRDAVRLLAKRVRRVQTLTQLKGRQHRPAGMVLLRYRRPKQGQEALAGDLEEGAVALHRILDQRQHGAHQVVHGLRPQARRQGGARPDAPHSTVTCLCSPSGNSLPTVGNGCRPWPVFPFPLAFSRLGK